MEGRIAALRAEIAASDDTTRKAALHFELGGLLERRDANPANAVREYLAAYNLDATFRPPLFALVRIFERRRSFKNLERLYGAEEQSSSSGADAASALVDRGVLLADHLGDPEGGKQMFERALDTLSTYAPAALMLEHSARTNADVAALPRVLERRAACTRDPRLRALLLAELADAWEARGELDEAFRVLQEAWSLGVEVERTLLRMERLARRHRRPELAVRALEALAERVPSEGADPQDAGRKAALLYDAARIHALELGDPLRAIDCLDSALAAKPNDVLLLEEHLLACELAGDLERAAEDARQLLAHGVSGRASSRLHFRMAELAQARGDAAGARAALERALAASPDSVTLNALFEDLLVDAGAHEERTRWLESRAASETGMRRALIAWRAAQIASEDLGDFERARTLYRTAVVSADDPSAILRELYGAARRHGRDEVALDAVLALLDRSIGDVERGTLLHEAFLLARSIDPENARVHEILDRAVRDDAASSWALEAARIHAASIGDDLALAAAHERLAEAQSEPADRAAHRCASARARLRGSDVAGAISALRSAIEEVPGHRYALALLEEVLEASGDGEAVVQLVRDAASSSDGSEASLLRAGAAAEAAGDPGLAARTYEEAADRDPTSVAPLLALRRLAERTNDRELLLRALEGLSEREIAAGDPGRQSLELGELYAISKNRPELAEAPLRAAMEGSSTEAAAALAIACLVPASKIQARDRIAALERLAEAELGPTREGLLRDAAITALLDGDAEGATRLLDRLRDDGTGTPAPAPALRLVAGWGRGDDLDRANHWIDFAESTSDERAAADLLLQGLRTKAIALGDGAEDDAFILAHELAAKYPGSMASAVALSETTGAADDPEARAEAFEARLERSGREGRSVLAFALARALVSADRAVDALPRITAELEHDPDDLTAWETLRVAARRAGRWEDVVTACDRLAQAMPPEWAALLLEEAGAVLMDKLDRDDEAATRLKRAFELDPGRVVAYGRLHDLLSERDDVHGLLALVARRIDAVDDDQERVKLLYEQARLKRSDHDREGALESLGRVLDLDARHVGALALAVEVNVSLERFEAAVEMLRRLALADVPASQRRLSYLGAADFLAKKLHDPAGALAELRKIEELGLSDVPLFVRMASLSEAGGNFAESAAFLLRAAKLAEGTQRAELARRAGTMFDVRLGDPDAAREAYRYALSAVPTDLEALEALLALSSSDEQRALFDAFESALRSKTLDAHPRDEDALSKLGRLAALRGQLDLQRHVEEALAVIESPASPPRTNAPALAANSLVGRNEASLFDTASLDAAALELAKAAYEALTEYAGLTTSALGVGRAELLSPRDASSAREDLFTILAAFGLELGDVYTSTSFARPLLLLPGKKDRIVGVLRADLARSSLDRSARFSAGQLAFGLAFSTTPLLLRAPHEAADLLFAVAHAAGVPLPDASESSKAHVAALGRLLSRRARRTITELVPSLRARGSAMASFARAIHRSARRAGLIASADLGVALRSLPSAAAAAHEGSEQDADDLFRFWTSSSTVDFLRAGTAS